MTIRGVLILMLRFAGDIVVFTTFETYLHTAFNETNTIFEEHNLQIIMQL